jgi:hypothetical protein
VAGALTLTGIAKRNPLLIHPDVLRRSAMPLDPRAWGRYARKRDSDGFWSDTWLS